MRASSADRVLRCPQSQVAPRLRIETPDEAARLGSALHDLIAEHILGDGGNTVAEMARDYQVDAEDLAFLFFSAAKCWEQLSVHFPDPVVEEELTEAGELGLHGHPDVIALRESTVTVLDWKTERVEVSHAHQLRAYGYLGLQRWPEADSVWACVVRVRDQQIDPVLWTRAELEAWYAWACERLSRDAETYTVGEHCRYCPRGHECEAKTAMLATAARIMVMAPVDGALSSLSDDILIQLRERAKTLESQLESLWPLLRAEIALRGGTITGPDGNGLALRTVEKRKLVPAKAWPILESRLGLPVLQECVKIGKGKVEDSIRAAAPARGGAAAIREVMAALDGAGAIVVNAHDEIRAVKPLAAKQLGQALPEETATEMPRGVNEVATIPCSHLSTL